MRPASGLLTVNYFATIPGESTLPQAASSADARRWGWSSARWQASSWKRSGTHCPNVLTVCYFKT